MSARAERLLQDEVALLEARVRHLRAVVDVQEQELARLRREDDERVLRLVHEAARDLAWQADRRVELEASRLVATYEATLSWRVTAPLRALRRAGRRPRRPR